MERRTDEQDAMRDDPDRVVVKRPRGRRIAAIAALSLLLLLLVALAGIWIARRPIASNLLEREFERRGVQATYELDRVGLRTQQVSDLVIGDPEDPDLTADFAQIQVRPKWDGSIEVYRIVARGVRLRGRLVDGRVSWGELDRLLPPPSDKPFQLPNFALDIADSSISLATPFGPFGIAVEGSGNLSGGFRGRVAVASPHLRPGQCRIEDLSGTLQVRVQARRPEFEGPVTLESLRCPQSNLRLLDPRLSVDARFNESFTQYRGSARVAIDRAVAGENALARLSGKVTFRGDPDKTVGEAQLAAQASRLASITAERTRISGGYRLGMTDGTLAVVGEFAANGATLPPSMTGSLTGPLAALSKTPVGPVAVAIGRSVERTTRNFDVSGDFRLVNFPGGGGARIENTQIASPTGARVRISGGDGVTYYWPSGQIRLDGSVQMSGGGLPTGRVQINQPRPGAPISGIAQFAPYSAGGSRLALAPVRFSTTRGGATRIDTVARIDGSFPDGQVRNLRLPIDARIGANGGFTLGNRCIVASFDALRFRDLRLGRGRLPICPAGQSAIVTQGPGGLQIGARMTNVDIAGQLGESPLRLRADSARIMDGKDFVLADAQLQLGNPESPVVIDADRLSGTFEGSGVSGTFSDMDAIIGNVPLRISDADGRWRFYDGDLVLNGDLLLSDRAEDPRFYPLASRDFELRLSGNDITAGGGLRHPESGTLVTNVAIRHDLATGEGSADLAVPGLTFGEGLQPEEITRLTEGVVALVQGTITGSGRISWDGEGEVTSTGEFSTVGMDLAAPFGPVTGLTTTIRFTDLLGLETAPGQTATVASINPGILVENGVIRYQLLPNQMVRIERGVWPFMGGLLILQETVLNFSRPTAKRLTFRLVGFNAKTFVDSLGFEGIEITGTFDGVLPMIFDEDGGRIVGGRLDSRPPGGRFQYTGTEPDAGLMVGVAFDLLSDMRYRHMIIRLEGDLAGEFATRFTIEQIRLGQEGGFIAGLVRNAFRNVPLKVNLSISGPFRALIQMAKGFEDPIPVIEPVMPFPLDAPGIVTETRVLGKEEEQTQVSPPQDEIDVSAEPPAESE